MSNEESASISVPRFAGANDNIADQQTHRIVDKMAGDEVQQ